MKEKDELIDCPVPNCVAKCTTWFQAARHLYAYHGWNHRQIGQFFIHKERLEDELHKLAGQMETLRTGGDLEG